VYGRRSSWEVERVGDCLRVSQGLQAGITEIWIRNSQALIFGAGCRFQKLELEEAIVVGLLAVGMSVMVVLTIMVFW